MKKICILLIVVFLITALCVWQRNNIKALYMFLTNDKDNVEKMIEENSKELEDKIKEYSEFVPRYFTPEEEAMIASGELSVEEATALLLGEMDSTVAENEPVTESKAEEITEDAETIPDKNREENSVNNKTEVTKPDKVTDSKTEVIKPGKVTDAKTEVTKPVTGSNTGTPDASKEDGKKPAGDPNEIIKRYTAQFYSLKAYYMGQLSQLESEAKNEYSAMTKEQRKNLSKASFAAKYVGRATTLEGECDGRVNGILSDMKAELKASGGDLSVIETIRQAYDSEKAARKAQYMSLIK